MKMPIPHYGQLGQDGRWSMPMIGGRHSVHIFGRGPEQNEGRICLNVKSVRSLIGHVSVLVQFIVGKMGRSWV